MIEKIWLFFKIIYKHIAVISILLAFVSLAWSIYTYTKVLPLQKAILSVSSPSDVVFLCRKNQNSCMERQNLYLCGKNEAQVLAFEPVFKNTGRASATEIFFKIYTIWFNASGTVEKSEKMFDEKMVNDLYPETQVSFGNITFPNSGREVLLIYHLQYIDSLTGESMDQAYWYKYNLSPDNLDQPYALLQSEKNKIDTKKLEELFKDDKFMLNNFVY